MGHSAMQPTAFIVGGQRHEAPGNLRQIKFPAPAKQHHILHRGADLHPSRPSRNNPRHTRVAVFASCVQSTAAAFVLKTYRNRRKNLRCICKATEVAMVESETKTTNKNAELESMLDQKYEFGFTTNVESDSLPKGVNEDIVRKIWEIKGEPEWMLEFRLNAFRKWKKMAMPDWAHLEMEPIDFQDIVYYSRPKTMAKKKSLDEVDPELLNTFEKLGIPLTEQKRLTNVAVDAIFDSESVGTTFQKELAEAGVIFCSINEAIKEHPELVKKYIGSVVPTADNYFTALNSAVFSDGSFCYIPKKHSVPHGDLHILPYQQ